MAKQRFGYDPTGTGKYGVGTLYNGVSGVNVLADGTKYYGNIKDLVDGKVPISASSESTVILGPKPLNLKKLPVAISVPGNIITEDFVGSEAQLVEELFEDLSLFELMEMGRSEAVLGLNINYQPIKNLSDIYFTYSPKRILALSGSFSDSDEPMGISLNQYAVDGSVSIDPLTGDMIVAVEDIKNGLVIQVEILSGGEIQDS